jgi:hypothetical protein
MPMPINADPVIESVVQKCLADPSRFNSVVLGRGPYWWRQRQICESIMRYRTTAAPSGNGVGKSFLAAGLVLWFAAMHPNSKTVVAAPTQDQLRGVVWSELASAYESASTRGMPLGGRLKDLSWDLGENWRVEGFGSGSVEARSGRHAGKLLAVIEEASGVHPDVMEAIDSLNPSHFVYLGNPLRPEGKFYDVCETQADNPHVNVIRVPSLDSPHIERARSPVGMADRTWLESVRSEYGEGSIWWLSHVLARFPNSAADALILLDWLTLAEQTLHVPGGPVRMAIDLALGRGGDLSVILTRDDNGILDLEASNRWTFEDTAARAATLCAQRRIIPARVSWDANGIGADFDNRLRAAGLKGCLPYVGSLSGGKHANLRSAAAWLARQRLNPGRMIKSKHGVMVRQHPFAIRPEFMAKLRPELKAHHFENHDDGGIALETAEDVAKTLKRSPDYAATFFQSFAFPHS